MEKKVVLISGGGGYIGSCTAYFLALAGYQPVILDNFSSSQRPKKFLFSTFEIDLTQANGLDGLPLEFKKAHAIFHFAAKALVPESTIKVRDYFYNNINATLNLSEFACRFSIPFFIHSSTCAVYGHPKLLPISETAPLNPLTPYGHSKLASENILQQYSQWKDLSVLNLRYFNPAGAIHEANLGELHEPETHLIPNLITSFIKNTSFEIFGNDYSTADGTCIRDYIHIKDLAKAHVLGLQFLESQKPMRFETLNIGSGKGLSVQEAITLTEKVFNQEAKVSISPRRPGDPPILIADNSKMKAWLKWEPEFSAIDMIRDHSDFIRLRRSMETL